MSLADDLRARAIVGTDGRKWDMILLADEVPVVIAALELADAVARPLDYRRLATMDISKPLAAYRAAKEGRNA